MQEIWTIITAYIYAENEDGRKDEKDKFFDELQKQIDNGEENIILMGNSNGRVGNKNSRMEEFVGPKGEETLNNNGERREHMGCGDSRV